MLDLHLRALKRGLERSVKAPLPYQKLKEKYELFYEYCRLRKKGLSNEAICRRLIKKGLMPQMSRQALLKRLADLLVDFIEGNGPLEDLEKKIMEDLSKCEDGEAAKQPRTLGEIRDRIRKKRRFSP